MGKELLKKQEKTVKKRKGADLGDLIDIYIHPIEEIKVGLGLKRKRKVPRYTRIFSNLCIRTGRKTVYSKKRKKSHTEIFPGLYWRRKKRK